MSVDELHAFAKSLKKVSSVGATRKPARSVLRFRQRAAFLDAAASKASSSSRIAGSSGGGSNSASVLAAISCARRVASFAPFSVHWPKLLQSETSGR